MSSIFTSLSPNTQKDDVFLVLKLLLQPWKLPFFAKGFGRASTVIIEEFKKYHSIQYAYSFNSGRSALMAILYAFGVGKDDDVLIQAFTCNAVPNPIFWAGAKPIYADIANDLNIDPAEIEGKITQKTKAVIVQHTFGIPAQMDRILEIARRHNLIVIEDCAHALGAKYKGKLVGALSDVSFFSFGRDKVISSVYGGIAATNNPEIARKLEEFWNQCKYPSYFWIFQQLLHPIIFAIALPLYNFFNIGKIIIKLGQLSKLLSLAVILEEKAGGKPPYFPNRMPEALAALALHQFKKIERFNIHRKELSKFYLRNLDPQKYRIPNILYSANNENIFLRFPVFHIQRDRILKQAKRHRVYLGDWYTSVVAPHDTDLEKMQYVSGSCPKAEAAAREAFNLPTHINISKEQAEKIVRFLNGYSRNS